jgi:DNA-binding transcriptional LysR family regulator
VTVTPDPLSGRELAAFVAAVDAHTLYAAADALALTQSAVTKRIAALERRIGQPLLERSRGGVRPTAAGRALYPEARAALAALERARRAVVDADVSSALAVAASHTVAGYLLPGLLAGFRAERGSLRIAVEVVNSPGVLAAVRAGRAELGFVEGIDSLEGLESQMLMTDELQCVVRPGHRFARRTSIRPAELLDEAWIARESESGTRAVAERALRQRGITLVPAL